MRRVKAAAVRFRNHLFTMPPPSRHHHIIESIASFIEPEKIDSFLDQGFVDQDDTFMSRYEAWKVAEAAGQLLNRAPTSYGGPGVLFSEDVW